MKVSITDQSTTEIPVFWWDQNGHMAGIAGWVGDREDLEERALQNVCDCYRESVREQLYELTDTELSQLIEDGQHWHYEFGYSLKYCPSEADFDWSDYERDDEAA